MSIKMEDLKVRHTYLVNDLIYFSKKIYQVHILLISETSFKVRWDIDVKPRIEWISKLNFCNNNNIFEDITELVKSIQTLPDPMTKENDFLTNETIKAVPCDRCNGCGQIIENESTSGLRLCPKCYGGKYLIK